jgi:hypothetical protein
MNIERKTRLTASLAASAPVNLNAALSSNRSGNQAFNLGTRVRTPLASSFCAFDFGLGTAQFDLRTAQCRLFADPIPIS